MNCRGGHVFGTHGLHMKADRAKRRCREPMDSRENLLRGEWWQSRRMFKQVRTDLCTQRLPALVRFAIPRTAHGVVDSVSASVGTALTELLLNRF